jgi:arylformamidase
MTPMDLGRLIDITRPLGSDTPVVPGDPAVTLVRVAEHTTHGYQVTHICLGSHSGTHLDAPRHFFPDGPALSDYPIERLIGPGVVIDVRPTKTPTGTIGPNSTASPTYVDPDRLAAGLRSHSVRPGEHVLLWTEGHATLSQKAAALLLEAEVGLVGIDGPSVDEEDTSGTDANTGDHPVHRLLLSAGVLLAENLCHLDQLGEGRIQCAFLPLAVKDTDGAPVRAVAWR